MRPEHSVARVCTAQGRPVGLAFFIGGGRLVTCAHVVNTALRRDRRTTGRPRGRVRVVFPFGTRREPAEADVTGWAPGRTWSPDTDLAVLRLPGPAPDGLTALTVAEDPGGADLPVQVCGPADGDGLKHVRGVLVGDIAPGRRQVNQERGGPFRVRAGFSGGPVWHRRTGEVLGVLRAARPEEDGSDAECVSLASLPGGTAGRSGAKPAGAIDLVQIGPLRLSEATGAATAERVCTAVVEDVRAQGLAPDLVALCGDLTAGALPAEYALVRGLVDRLGAELELPPERFLPVPGPRDVNRRLCEAYFLAQDGIGEPAVPPYWEKWRPYSAFLADLHGEPLPKDRPWSWWELTEPRVAVAGVNATMAHSHRPGADVPELGAEQPGWFAARAADDRAGSRLRLAVGYLPDGSAAEAAAWADLVLAGGEGAGRDRVLRAPAGGHVLVRVKDRTATTWRDGRRTGTALPVREPARAEAAPERRVDRHVRRVVEALAHQVPAATLDPVAASAGALGYVRVTTRHDFGAGRLEPTGEYPVGVVPGAVTRADVEWFASNVVNRMRTPGAVVGAQLVYFGPVAEPAVVGYARGRGITVVSFARFQFDWDPRPFVAWQTDDLDADPRYPRELYIPHRYREIGPDGGWIDGVGRRADAPAADLAGRVADWVAETDRRLVVVLGAAGSGKTYFLRTLTRALSAEDRGVTPVYLQLRELERIPALDEMVAARFTRAAEHRLPVDKFNYFLREGRIALLLDGLDELTVQSNYDKAIGYLAEIGRKSVGRAKIVVTARDVEFLSNREVLRALGGTRAVIEGRRALHVEEFGTDQIVDFLGRRLGRERARERIELLGGIDRLPEVTRNPRMLSFIAVIDKERLLTARDRAGGELNGAELYRQVLEQWMQREAARLDRPGQSPAMTEAELWTAVTALAMHLWRTDRETASLDDLGRAAGALSEVDRDPRVHQLGTGSLLIRDEEDGFGFIHRSVREWLVAKHIADGGRLGEDLSRHRLSAQAADFLFEMADHEELRGWADTVYGSGERRDQSSVVNAGMVQGAFSSTRSASPNRVDLSRQRLSGSALTGVVLAGADARRAELDNTELAGRDLSGADFTDATLAGADLAGVDATEAVLTGADLTGASLLGADLTGAVLSRTTLRRAALTGAQVTPGQLAEAHTEGAALPQFPVTVEYAGNTLGHCAALDPRSELLALPDRAGSIGLWDLRDGTCLRRLPVTSGRVRSLCWSPDGARLLAGTAGGLVCFDAERTEPLWSRVLDDAEVSAVDWSRTGAIVVTTTRPTMYLVIGETSVVRDPYRLGAREYTAIKWSPNGRLLAYADWRGSVGLVNAAAEQVVAATAHAEIVRALAWNPSSRRVALGDDGGGVTEWRVDVRQPDERVPLNAGRVWFLAYSPNASALHAGTEDGTVRRVRETPERRNSDADGLPSAFVAPEPVRYLGNVSGTGLVVAEGGSVTVWRSGKRAWQRTDTEPAPTTAAWSANGAAVVVGSADGTLRAWNVKDGTVRWTGTAGPGRAYVDWSPHRGFIVAAGEPGELGVHSPSPSRRGRGTMRRGSPLHGVRWADGGIVAVVADVGAVGTVELWDTNRGGLVHAFELGPRIHDLVFSAAEKVLYACGNAGLIARLDPVAREVIWRRTGEHMERTALAYLPDEWDGRLVAGTRGGAVCVCDPVTGAEQRDWIAHDGEVTALSGADGRFASGGSDGVLRLWTPAGELLAEWPAHAGSIGSIRHSPDRTRLLTAGDDGLARIWDAATGEHRLTLMAFGEEGTAAVAGDGKRFKVTGRLDGQFWFASGQVRIDPYEAAKYVPEFTMVAPDEPVVG